MSLDLYQQETAEKINSLPGVMEPEVGTFDGFFRGTGMATMQSFAKAGRAASMAVAAPLARLDDIIERTNQSGVDGVRLSDSYFKWHDDVLGRAVDYWSPRPNEVGAAGQVVGQLLGTLPFVIASPATAVAMTELGTAEDLVREGVSPGKATAVGVAQGAGLGLGIWMPILGQNLWQRAVIGGAGFNVVQGVGTRAASSLILDGEKAGEQFKAFDGQAMTLDVLLGAAFGSLSHLSPAQRKQGAEVWERVRNWASDLKPSDVDAIATLRQAQHANVDSMGGTPKDVADIEAHRTRLDTAVEQLARDQPVHVEDLPAPRVEADPVRNAEAQGRAEALQKEAERVRKAEGIPDITETEGPAAKPGGEAEPPPPRGDVAPVEAAGPEADPIAIEADRAANARPDLPLRIGTDANGEPIVKSVRQFLDDARTDSANAREDARLFEVAAACMLGAS